MPGTRFSTMTALAASAWAGTGLITLLPKDPAYAANSRFVLTLSVFALVGIGMNSGIVAWRSFHENRLRRRYEHVSSAVKDTLTHLRHETRLARRGRLAALNLSLAAVGLHFAAHWPQSGWVAATRPFFGYFAIGALAAVPLLALRQRGHYVNTLFLKRYLQEQVDHLGPEASARRPVPSAPSGVVVTGPGRFKVGDFEWRFEDLQTNVLVLGQTGAGKTLSVLNNLLGGVLASHGTEETKIAGLVLDAKGDWLGRMDKLCTRLGRSDDLVVLDPETWATHGETARSIAWNPLDNDEPAREVATRIVAALAMIGLQSGAEGSYFLDSARGFLEHAIILVRAAMRGDAPSLLDVLGLSQESEAETPLYHDLIRRIGERYPEEVPADVLHAIAYFERNWGAMADRERSGLRGTINQILAEFLGDPFAEIFTRPSTVDIGELIDNGGLLHVHLPISRRPRLSRLVNTLLKLEFQRQILLRPDKVRPSFLLADEFQTAYTVGDGTGDSDFFERSRQSNHASIVAVQNLSSFLKGTRNAADVRNLAGNCGVKIFLRNTEEETLRWASALFGQRSEIVITTQEQAALVTGWSRRRHTSYGRSTRSLPKVPPEAFPALVIPGRGPEGPFHAEALVHLGSRGAVEHLRLNWPINLLE